MIGRFIRADSITPDWYNPQSLNRYAYCYNNPLKYQDPDGNVPVETVLDVISIGESIVSFVKKPSWLGAGYIAWDVAATALPYVPGSWTAKGAKYTSKLLGAGDKVNDVRKAINKVDDVSDTVKVVDNATDVAKNGKNFAGNQNRQQRLKDLVNDDKVSSADRGWIKQEMNEVSRGKKDHLRNPPGKDLAHERGREKAKGYGYEHTNLKNREDHQSQHKLDDWGRKNKERPYGY